jgi:hypothetical protein
MKQLALCISAAILLMGGGCTAPVITGVAAVAEYGSGTFNSGALQPNYPNQFEHTVIAVRKTIADLGLRPVSDVPDDQANFVYIKAVDEAGEEIFFRIRRRGQMLTRVAIRVGILGDEPYATALSRHISALLDPDSDTATPPPDLRILNEDPTRSVPPPPPLETSPSPKKP